MPQWIPGLGGGGSSGSGGGGGFVDDVADTVTGDDSNLLPGDQGSGDSDHDTGPPGGSQGSGGGGGGPLGAIGGAVGGLLGGGGGSSANEGAGGGSTDVDTGAGEQGGSDSPHANDPPGSGTTQWDALRSIGETLTGAPGFGDVVTETGEAFSEHPAVDAGETVVDVAEDPGEAVSEAFEDVTETAETLFGGDGSGAGGGGGQGQAPPPNQGTQPTTGPQGGQQGADLFDGVGMVVLVLALAGAGWWLMQDDASGAGEGGSQGAA